MLIGVGVLWPLIAFAGGLGFSPLVTLAALLCLPFALLRLRPQIYMIGIITFLAFAAASITWSHRTVQLFLVDFAAGKFAVTFEVLRISLVLFWSAILMAAASRIDPDDARNVVSVATWAILAQLVVVAVLILFQQQALELFSFAMPDPGEGVQNIARNGIIMALAAPFLIVGFGRQLSFSRALIVEIGVFAVVVAVLAFGDVIGPIMSVGFGIASVAVVRIFPRSGFKLIGLGIAIFVMTAPFTFGILSSGSDPATVSNSIDWRLAIWKRVIEVIQENPMTGHGLGAFRTMDEIIPSGEFAGRLLTPNHPHNMALQIWVELGVFGAAIFSLMIILVSFRLPEPGKLGVPGFLAAALAGQFVAISLSFDLWNDWLWACAGILATLFVVMARTEADDDPQPERTPEGLKPAIGQKVTYQR
ncbi:MAG TPA: O-antigen ligase family protein [Hyphomonadaceae bacterium]|nr:O-antigen ligase family protein [Hyphomonadaceae bacterium]